MGKAKESLRKFVDEQIRYWRIQQRVSDDPANRVLAAVYLDAFQAVRLLLDKEESDGKR